ncbi:MAG: hypothetical protein AAFX99_21020 [Myxococcota bacterium]
MTEFVVLIAIKTTFLMALSARIFGYMVRDNEQIDAEPMLVEHLEQLAQRTGLELSPIRFERHRLLPQRLSLTGHVRGCPTTLTLNLIQMGGNLRLEALEVDIRPFHAFDSGLLVQPRRVRPLSPITSPIQSGDRAFDQTFIISADHPERAMRLLNSNVRTLLCDLFDDPDTWLRLDDRALVLRRNLHRMFLTPTILNTVLLPYLEALPDRLDRIADTLHNGHASSEQAELCRPAPTSLLDPPPC